MAVFRLPVSGIDVVLRPPAGVDDVLLAEAGAHDAHLALALLERLAVPLAGEPVDWALVPIPDLDAAMLRIRQMVLGDHLRAEVICRAQGCGARIDIAFRISEYLAHHQPKSARGVVPGDEPGWFRLADAAVTFRLPSGADQAAVTHAADSAAALAQRCVRPSDVPLRVRRRVEAAMETLAPSLYNDLEGVCPECSATVSVPFDPQRYVLRELSSRAASCYQEIHLLASHYHWSEQEILALPQPRRARYAELIHQDRSGV